MSEQAIDGARAHATVPVTPDAAFARFTTGLQDWWPRQYTWSGEALRDVGIEPRPDGLCFEFGPYGFRCDWGRVLVWQPPDRLTLAWHVGPTRVPQPDPAWASEIDVWFEPEGGATRVDLLHHGFDRHGPGAAEYQAAMDGPEGWDYILSRYEEGWP